MNVTVLEHYHGLMMAIMALKIQHHNLHNQMAESNVFLFANPLQYSVKQQDSLT